MPLERWASLNDKIARERLSFENIQNELLQILEDLDKLRKTGKIEEGAYRQKGNYFRKTIIALVRARCDVALKEETLEGQTDIHKVDFAFINSGKSVKLYVVAGEAKMLGSPTHFRDGKQFPERTISIDIDKRIKEVKYTPIDLKRRFSAQMTKGWSKWIDDTYPKFFSAWLMRLGSGNRLSHVISKLEGICEYNNAVGVAIYTEIDGKYQWVEHPLNSKLLDIDQFVKKICEEILRYREKSGTVLDSFID
ncbi:MAG: hypothetical protein H0Z28_10055 [Archaeoglobus sp.]|nr:hypothetical protein [Archaeoglobus sp.]